MIHPKIYLTKYLIESICWFSIEKHEWHKKAVALPDLIWRNNISVDPAKQLLKNPSPHQYFLKKLFAPLHFEPVPLYSKFCTVRYGDFVW